MIYGESCVLGAVPGRVSNWETNVERDMGLLPSIIRWALQSFQVVRQTAGPLRDSEGMVGRVIPFRLQPILLRARADSRSSGMPAVPARQQHEEISSHGGWRASAAVPVGVGSAAESLSHSQSQTLRAELPWMPLPRTPVRYRARGTGSSVPSALLQIIVVAWGPAATQVPFRTSDRQQPVFRLLAIISSSARVSLVLMHGRSIDRWLITRRHGSRSHGRRHLIKL